MRCADVGGLNLHAAVRVPAGARGRLERLCRYVLRPSIATERLSSLPDGRLLYALRRPWSDGTTHVMFEPLDFLARLCALIPAPHGNLVTYHGVLAFHAKWRPLVVPRPPEEIVADAAPPEGVAGSPRGGKSMSSSPRRLSWAERAVARGDASDLRAFGWWFASRHVESAWGLPTLECVLVATEGRIDWDNGVAEKLKDLAPTAPVEVARSLRRFVDAADEWQVGRSRNAVRATLEILVASPAAESAREIAARLVARELFDFRDLAETPDGA